LWRKKCRAKQVVNDAQGQASPQENIAAVRELIEGDFWLTVVEICQDIGTCISYGSVESIIKNELLFRKISARWVPQIPDPKPHSTALTQAKLAKMYWTALEHPPYSLDLSP
jgi:hypothetical protein